MKAIWTTLLVVYLCWLFFSGEPKFNDWLNIVIWVLIIVWLVSQLIKSCQTRCSLCGAVNNGRVKCWKCGGYVNK